MIMNLTVAARVVPLTALILAAFVWNRLQRVEKAVWPSAGS